MQRTVSRDDRRPSVAPAARELADMVDVPAIAAAVAAEILGGVWADLDDPDFRATVHRSVLENVESIFDVIRGRSDIASCLPQGALEFAEVTAQLGVPAAEVERCYRTGVTFLWAQWFGLACEHAEETGAPLADLLEGPTLAILGYVDHILAPVIARHNEIRTELHATRAHVRRMSLAQVLDGSVEEPTKELDASLDYFVADTHLAMLVTVPDALVLDETVARLRSAADARASLLFQHGPRSWLVWLGRPVPFTPRHLTNLRRQLTTSRLVVTVSDPYPGIAGLRFTRDQVLGAARVQRALGVAGHRCLFTSEVRLETMMLGDEPRARAFVAAELGDLGASDAAAVRLRETLLTWLSTGSHISAAAILGVHENTVRNRIRQAERLLDAPLRPPRTELQVALRLERVLRVQEADGLPEAVAGL
ncbi:MAG: hypothetical protein JWN65_2508 [Solirubrobacterales bacterium]|nr:hypothetical protein [Solirubrobacterales bacterium]